MVSSFGGTDPIDATCHPELAKAPTQRCACMQAVSPRLSPPTWRDTDVMYARTTPRSRSAQPLACIGATTPVRRYWPHRLPGTGTEPMLDTPCQRLTARPADLLSIRLRELVPEQRGAARRSAIFRSAAPRRAALFRPAVPRGRSRQYSSTGSTCALRGWPVTSRSTLSRISSSVRGM